MRLLFIVQGEGRGHLTQALAARAVLEEAGHEVSCVLAASVRHRQIPAYFIEKVAVPVRRFASAGFNTGREYRSIRPLMTLVENLARIPKFRDALEKIHRTIESVRPDLVLSFYEPMAGVYHLLYRPRVPFVAVGHQYMFEHPAYSFAPGTTIDRAAISLFTRLTALGADWKLALSMYPAADLPEARLTVIPPLLRRQLPAYDGLENARYGSARKKMQVQMPGKATDHALEDAPVQIREGMSCRAPGDMPVQDQYDFSNWTRGESSDCAGGESSVQTRGGSSDWARGESSVETRDDVPEPARKDVQEPALEDRSGNTTGEDFFLIYLLNRGYAEQIIDWHEAHREIRLHCFWDYENVEEVFHYDDTLTFHGLDDVKFMDLMSRCSGLACTAGFESACEALYLRKPILAVPVEGHYEQQCNAREIEMLGAGLQSARFDLSLLTDFTSRYDPPVDAFREWVALAPDRVVEVLERVVARRMVKAVAAT